MPASSLHDAAALHAAVQHGLSAYVAPLCALALQTCHSFEWHSRTLSRSQTSFEGESCPNINSENKIVAVPTFQHLFPAS